MDPEIASAIASLAALVVACTALGVSVYAAKLSKDTGVVLEETKKVLTSTKEVLENQQCALMAMGEILGGADFSKIYLFTLFNQSKVREAERRGTLEDLRLSRTGELYFEADGDPAKRKENETQGEEEKEQTSPQEPPSKTPTEAPAPEADVPPVSDPGQGASPDASPDEPLSRTDEDASCPPPAPSPERGPAGARERPRGPSRGQDGRDLRGDGHSRGGEEGAVRTRGEDRDDRDREVLLLLAPGGARRSVQGLGSGRPDCGGGGRSGRPFGFCVDEAPVSPRAKLEGPSR